MATRASVGDLRGQDVIDSRDVIARIEHLQALRQPGPIDLGDDNDTDQDALFAELAELEALAAEGEDVSSEWSDGEALIADSHFEAYAQELAEDLGFKAEGWPGSYIDWDRAARELQHDYTSVSFGEVDYWIRSY